MTARTIFARRVLAVLVFVLSLFSRASTWAASVSLAWNPSPSPTVTGYEVFYGLASGDYTLSIDAGTNTSITMSGLTSGVTYYIAVLAYDTNQNDSLLSNEVIDSPLTLTTEPLAQAVGLGATASFAVSATGTAPLTYQWFDGATALAGATNATLTLLNVSNANAGNYSVVITDSSGSVTSSVVTLSVVNLPVITSQPVAQTVSPGALAYFNVSVQGTGPFTYQWLHNGTALPSGPGLNFLLITVTSANLGNYSVAVANNNGTVTSSAASLQTPGPPALAIAQSGKSIVVSWPSSATGFTLQQNANLATTNWMTSAYPISTNGTTESITISSPSGNMFFRLFNP